MPEPIRSETPPPSKLPAHYIKFQSRYPAVFEAVEGLGTALRHSGPLDEKSQCLVKLGIAAGARLEGAVHSHTRRALEAGCSADEIRQVVLLALTTIGFPGMMAVLSWVDDVLPRE